ncbi:hypothetical protein BDV95DRAFT_596905 [Massariosphaeria phaeospora]|uniref:Uncharacterized protein n=1 Tax=Massariosphaeria phaeospora TaxID=100035 RepID=A0A7C8M523_9PLEO|nr:hypothetical protein BDV95DRAFT_596905 [Massariosphaeria phaeospora]
MADSTVPDSGASAVHIGFWQNYDGGRLQGALLTLSNQNAAALLSFLAVAVTFAANRSWKICRFVLYQYLRTHTDENDTAAQSRRQLQVILRNIVTAGSTLWTFIDMFWTRRRERQSALQWNWKPTVLAILSATHLAGFIAAGILTSKILVGRIVVSKRIDSCGQWQAKNSSDPASLLSYQTLRLNETLDAENYVRNCYGQGVSRGILDCGKLFTRSLPYQVEHDVACPFGDDLCSDNPKGAYAMDSGLISFSDLGINSQFASRLSVQRRSLCTVVPDGPFKEQTLTSDDLPVTLRANETIEVYKFLTIDEEDDSNLYYRSDNYSGTYNLMAYHLPYEPEQIAAPIRPNPNDHDASVILLRQNGVQYLTTHDDPWFSVKQGIEFDNSTGLIRPDLIRYETDRFLNVLACDERVRFCNALTNTCSPWTGLYTSTYNLNTAISILAGPSMHNTTTAYDELGKTVTLVSLSLPLTSLPDSIRNRPGASALQAARYLNLNLQYHLEPAQWKIELNYWFSMALARLQLELFNTIEKPPSVDEAQAVNTWSDSGLTSLCGRIKFRSANHASLSAVGVGLVVGLVTLLVLGSWVDGVLAWVPGEWAQRVVREWQEWENLSMLGEIEGWRARIGDLSDPFEVRGWTEVHETK